MIDHRCHPLGRIATAAVVAAWAGTVVFLCLAQSFRAFCHEIVRLAGRLLLG